jgi:hypothetical protein
MSRNTLNVHHLGELFYRFEAEHAVEIQALREQDFLAWQILKSPYYFSLIQMDPEAPEVNIPALKSNRLLTMLKWLLLWTTGISWLLKYFLLTRLRKNRVFIFASAADKLAPLKTGGYYNYITDNWVAAGIAEKYIYAERSGQGDFKTPSVVVKNINADRIIKIVQLKDRFSKKNSRGVSAQLAALFGQFCAGQNVSIPLSELAVERCLGQFRAEYKTWKQVFRFIRPAYILSSEQPGSGFMGAAIKRKIPFLELQHGIIDKYHPQYTFHPALKPYKKQMVIPGHTGVFGQAHKDQLLENGFWNDGEMVVLGNCRIEMERAAAGESRKESAAVLLATQWTFFEETKAVIGALAADKNHISFQLLVKLHPLESKEHSQYYHSMAEAHPELFKIAQRNDNAYELIRKCKLLIGFNSTVMLESVSLGTPCISLTTPAVPQGILSLINGPALAGAFELVPFHNTDMLIDVLNKAVTDEAVYQQMCERTISLGDALYASGYTARCRDFHRAMMNN